MIPYSRQSINQDDIEAVIDVLRSDFLTQGPVVGKFEKAICEYTGADHAVAVNSGTSALHIACLALGLKQGDYLWTTPITFVASANCGRYCGAEIDFVDIDPDSWNISVEHLSEKLESASKSNRLPKILVVVHMAGLPADIIKIHQLSVKYGFAIIEDACHALGAKYHGEPVGNNRFSDITTFSFHPVKAIATGEGGMALTNNAELARKMRLVASHGISRDPGYMDQAPDGDWYYQQTVLGYNYRLSDIHAALGLSQLTRIDEFIQTRQEIAFEYDKQLVGLPVQTPLRNNDSLSAYHLYQIVVKTESKCERKKIFDYLRQRGIGVNVHYIPVHLQPYYKARGFSIGDYPCAENYYENAISLPCFPALGNKDQQFVIYTLKELLI